MGRGAGEGEASWRAEKRGGTSWARDGGGFLAGDLLEAVSAVDVRG